MAKLTAKLINKGVKLVRSYTAGKMKKMLKLRVKGAVLARALRSFQQMEEYRDTAKKASVRPMLQDYVTLLGKSATSPLYTAVYPVGSETAQKCAP